MSGLWGPGIIGGKLAIRGTRLSVELIPECLSNGMTLDDIDESFHHSFPHAALPEALKVASEFAGAFHVAGRRKPGRPPYRTVAPSSDRVRYGREHWLERRSETANSLPQRLVRDSLLSFTRDRLFAESASRAWRVFPGLCVVIVTLPQLPSVRYLEEFTTAWSASPIRPQPGKIVIRP
jgi:uncharacterized protein (DUF433 family)